MKSFHVEQIRKSKIKKRCYRKITGFSSSTTILTLFALLRCSLCLCGSTITWTTPGPLVPLSACSASISSMSTCMPPSTSWCVSVCVAVSSSCARWGFTIHPGEKETCLYASLAGCWSVSPVCRSPCWGMTPRWRTPRGVSQSCPWGKLVLQQLLPSWS